MSLRPLVEVRPDSDFSIHNLPLGIFTAAGRPQPLICTALGDHVVDIAGIYELGYLHGLEYLEPQALLSDNLNELASAGRPVLKALRSALGILLSHTDDAIRAEDLEKILVPMREARMRLPVHVGSYTDFYSSEYHATNVGAMFRDPANALLPNWKYVPIAYHGRATSIVPSGTPIRRPKGQIKPPDSPNPIFGPTRQFDYELEMAFIVGQGNELGTSVDVAKAEEHMFGLVLFNDWSARDVQAWEYQPLGPFLAKNFASTVSPWVVTMDALEPFRVESPDQNPEVLPYLSHPKRSHFDIEMEVVIKPYNSNDEVRIGLTNHKYLYWSMAQQLAHHSSNGCNLQPGDMCASGTISGPTPDSLGCLLETTRRGQNPIQLPNGDARTFLQDGDEVIMRGWAKKGEMRIGFGECRGTIIN